jgi:hypothetical protein
MKTKSNVTLFLAALALLVFSGCQSLSSSSTAPTANVDTAAAVTKIAVSNIVLPVLANNPKYEPALLAVAAGVDIAFAAKEITPAGINSFLDTIALKYEMDPATRLYIGSGLMDLLDVYHAQYGAQVVSAADPRVVAMLNALRDGIKVGIERYRSFRFVEIESSKP